jgi:DNA topoisomerase IB
VTGRLAVRAMAVAAAEWLHHTPAIARSAYIHPTALSLAGLDPEARRERLRRAFAAAVAPFGIEVRVVV